SQVVAYGLFPGRIPQSDVALDGSLASLIGGNAETSGEREKHGDRRDSRPSVASHHATKHVHPRSGSRFYRLPDQDPSDIELQRLDGRIATRGLLPERLGHDRIE